jgi:hypothetical protein
MYGMSTNKLAILIIEQLMDYTDNQKILLTSDNTYLKEDIMIEEDIDEIYETLLERENK